MTRGTPILGPPPYISPRYQGIAVGRLYPAMVPWRRAPHARGARGRAPAHVELGLRHAHRRGILGTFWTIIFSEYFPRAFKYFQISRLVFSEAWRVWDWGLVPFHVRFLTLAGRILRLASKWRKHPSGGHSESWICGRFKWFKLHSNAVFQHHSLSRLPPLAVPLWQS